MAIQNRRGNYTDFDPTKMVAGEFAVVQNGDPNGTDGEAVYIAPKAGKAKRLATADEMRNLIYSELEEIIEETEQALEDDVQRAEDAAESVELSAQQITINAQDIASIKDEISTILSDTAKAALLNCFAHTVYTDTDADYYGILRSALYAGSYPKLIATFYSGTHEVYQGDSLDSLKPYLTVKYYEDKDTSTTISANDYTLSGSLVEGVQTIYVRYTTLTASFTVEVSNPFIYRLPNTPVTFDGTYGIDTGQALLAENRSFTLALEFVDRRNYTFDTIQNYTFGCYLPSSPYTGIFMQVYDGGVGSTSTRRKIRHVVRCTPPGNSGGGQVVFDNDIAESDVVGRVIRFCFRYDSDSGTVKALFSVNKGTVTQTVDSILYTYTAIESKLIVGARMGASSMSNFMTGECNDFRVYDSALTDAEMQAYIEGVA